MALTASIGPVPPEWQRKRPQPTPKLAGADAAPQLLVLMATVQFPGRPLQQVPLAVALSRQPLYAALSQWLTQPENRQQYVNHAFQTVPLLIEE